MQSSKITSKDERWYSFCSYRNWCCKELSLLIWLNGLGQCQCVREAFKRFLCSCAFIWIMNGRRWWAHVKNTEVDALWLNTFLSLNQLAQVLFNIFHELLAVRLRIIKQSQNPRSSSQKVEPNGWVRSMQTVNGTVNIMTIWISVAYHLFLEREKER